jgi:hypothetical protein
MHFQSKTALTSGTNYKYPLSSRQALWLRSKAREGKIVDYLTDEQRSYGGKEPVELGADLQFGPLVPQGCFTLSVHAAQTAFAHFS